MVDFLLGNGGDLAVLAHDPGAVPIPETVAMPPQVDAADLDRLGKALRAGDLDLVGVWGSPRAGQHEAVYALARAAGMPLRQVANADIEDALNIAAALGAILWLRTDDLDALLRRDRAADPLPHAGVPERHRTLAASGCAVCPRVRRDRRNPSVVP